jgi:hypothetical protein
MDEDLITIERETGFLDLSPGSASSLTLERTGPMEKQTSQNISAKTLATTRCRMECSA